MARAPAAMVSTAAPFGAWTCSGADRSRPSPSPNCPTSLEPVTKTFPPANRTEWW